MIKKILPLVLIVLLFITLGCFTAEIGMNIGPDGKGTMSIMMDMTAMKPFVDMNADAGVMYTKANICETFMKSAQDPSTAGTTPTPGISDIKDFTCEAIDDYKVKLNSKQLDFVEQGLLTIDGDTYTLTLKGNNDGNAAEVTPEQKQQMKMLGVKMSYVIAMPGPVLETNAGTINGNKVTIDLIENLEKLNEGIVIKSNGPTGGFMLDFSDPMILAGIGGGVIVIIIIIILVVVLMKKKKPKSKSDTFSKVTDAPENPIFAKPKQ